MQLTAEKLSISTHKYAQMQLTEEKLSISMHKCAQMQLTAEKLSVRAYPDQGNFYVPMNQKVSPLADGQGCC
jgi:hypothetical protein